MQELWVVFPVGSSTDTLPVDDSRDLACCRVDEDIAKGRDLACGLEERLHGRRGAAEDATNGDSETIC